MASCRLDGPPHPIWPLPLNGPMTPSWHPIPFIMNECFSVWGQQCQSCWGECWPRLLHRLYLSCSPTLQDTGVHPCSCKSQSLPAPDTHLTNTDSRTPCHTCMTRWVGRGGVGIRCFSNIHLRFTRPSVYKKSRQYVFEKNMVMFTPNSDQFRGIWGPPSENKNESWHKTDCCNVLSDYC